MSLKLVEKILLIIFLTVSLSTHSSYAFAQPEWWKAQEERKVQKRQKAQERPRSYKEWRPKEGWKSKKGWNAQNVHDGGRDSSCPYGDYYPGFREGRYGARRAVRTEAEARNILQWYFSRHLLRNLCLRVEFHIKEL